MFNYSSKHKGNDSNLLVKEETFNWHVKQYYLLENLNILKYWYWN